MGKMSHFIMSGMGSTKFVVPKETMAAGDLPNDQMIQYFIEENGYENVTKLIDAIPGFKDIEAFQSFDEAEDNAEGWVAGIDADE